MDSGRRLACRSEEELLEEEKDCRAFGKKKKKKKKKKKNAKKKWKKKMEKNGKKMEKMVTEKPLMASTEPPHNLQPPESINPKKMEENAVGDSLPNSSPNFFKQEK